MTNLHFRGSSSLSAIVFIFLFTTSSAFYMPGVRPQDFSYGEEVPLKVNSMTSIHTQIPKDYYRLPFCEPEGGPTMASENLGEFLTGNKIQNSPYTINMLQDVFCALVCQKTLTRFDSKLLKMHIKHAYHHNWIIDNLPSASLAVTEKGSTQKHYAGGFPVGFYRSVSPDTVNAYVYNHVNIVLDYHKPDTGEGYRVVGFSVEPRSIKHKFHGGYEWDGVSTDVTTKQLSTCTPSVHISRDIPIETQIVQEGQNILYTYDVIWKPSEIAWSSRWDVYLTEDHQVPAQVHWYSITNSILVVVFLSLLVISILIRNLRRDIAGYNAMEALSEEEKAEEIDESGWKLIHADVFRPPQSYPMLFCVMVGSGFQIASSIFGCIALSFIGFINPSRRGSLMIAVLVMYMLCGSLAGYVSSRLYKAFRGRSWQLCTVFTATAFPAICFVIFLTFNIILAFFRSSGSVPFLDVLIVAAMWCCVSIPLVFIGAFFGYKKNAIKYPTVTSTIARAIPPPTAILSPNVNMCMAGLVPFVAAYVELFFMMTSLWMDQYYYVFGFTLIVFIILLVTCAEITVLMVYYQLCSENHRWWWFSFITSGSVAIYMFMYSAIWFRSLHPSRIFMTYLLYFGYMFLISLAMFLATGMIGALTSLWFVCKIFSSIKVD